jgi:Ca2+-binding EF-hand superfamily protein
MNIMKSTKFIIMFMALILSFAGGPTWSEAKQSLNSEEIMDVTDLDGDGRIDIKEYGYRITDVYFFLDADKDGKLTVVEIQRSMPNLDADQIGNADVNGDNIITIYEFRYVLYKDFDEMDKNQDGSIDGQEMEGTMEEK